MSISVVVLDGNIALEPADALITTCTPKGELGPVGVALSAIAGNYFTLMLLREKPLHDGREIVVRCDPNNKMPFGCVIFVVDDFTYEIRDIVLDVLGRADREKCEAVTLSPFRLSEIQGYEEETICSVLHELAAAIVEFINRGSGPVYLKKITIVVDGDLQRSEYLRLALKKINN